MSIENFTMTAPAGTLPGSASLGAARRNDTKFGIRARVDTLWTINTSRAVFAPLITIGFCFAILAAAATNAWTSDDVFVQNIVRSLQRGAAFAPIVGGDNFAIKVPLYVLVGLILPDGPAALTITTIAVNLLLVGAVLLLVDRATAHHGRVALLGGYLLVAWFLVSRIAPMSSLMIPNGRNGEIGFVLLLMAWWASRRRRRPDVLLGRLSVLPLALLLFSDGFFTYVLVGTTVLVAGASWLFGLPYKQAAVRILGRVALAALLALSLERVVKAMGLEVLQNYANALPPAGELPSYFFTVLGSIARDYNGDTAGRPLALSALPSLLQVLLTVVVLLLVALVLVSGRIKEDLRIALGVAIVITNVGLYVLTSNAADPYSFRYVLLAAVVLLILATTGIADAILLLRRWPRLVQVTAAVAMITVLLSLALNVRTTIRSALGDLPNPQARTSRIIQIAEQRGLTVGVGDYWDGNITTYLSGGRVQVVPQDCTSGRMLTRAWLINRQELAPAPHALFAVVHTATGCTPKILRDTFGPPDERVALPDRGDFVWIYNKPLP